MRIASIVLLSLVGAAAYATNSRAYMISSADDATVKIPVLVRFGWRCSRVRPMRSARVWVSRTNSALVASFTQRKPSEPSERSTNTSSRNSM